MVVGVRDDVAPCWIRDDVVGAAFPFPLGQPSPRRTFGCGDGVKQRPCLQIQSQVEGVELVVKEGDQDCVTGHAEPMGTVRMRKVVLDVPGPDLGEPLLTVVLAKAQPVDL